MENYANGPEIPMGLGMALAQNQSAMTYFANCTKERKQQIIDHTHSVSSRREMQAFVSSLGGGVSM